MCVIFDGHTQHCPSKRKETLIKHNTVEPPIATTLRKLPRLKDNRAESR